MPTYAEDLCDVWVIEDERAFREVVVLETKFAALKLPARTELDQMLELKIVFLVLRKHLQGVEKVVESEICYASELDRFG